MRVMQTCEKTQRLVSIKKRLSDDKLRSPPRPGSLGKPSCLLCVTRALLSQKTTLRHWNRHSFHPARSHLYFSLYLLSLSVHLLPDLSFHLFLSLADP